MGLEVGDSVGIDVGESVGALVGSVDILDVGGFVIGLSLQILGLQVQMSGNSVLTDSQALVSSNGPSVIP